MTIDVHCLGCHHEWEELFFSHSHMIKAIDGGKIPCPKCGNRKLKRLFAKVPYIPNRGPGSEKLSDNHLTVGHAFDREIDGIWY